jgi:glucose/arabinose dehydrogenase
MNKFRLLYFIGSILLIILVFTKTSSSLTTSQFLSQSSALELNRNGITHPIPEPIKKSKLAVGLEEVVQIPDSGTAGGAAPLLNFLSSAGDGSGRLFVNDMRGYLYVIVNGKPTVYLNVRQKICADFTYEGSQQGLSYFVFHPDFSKNGIFYTVTSELKTSGTPDFPVTKTIFDSNKNIIKSSHHDVIREWKATNPASNTFEGTSRELLRIEQPYPDHNVGQLSFNPNAKPGSDDYGMLYIAVADGGSDGGVPVGDTDPLDNGQDLGTPLGKMLRIDPLGNNSENGKYGIPNDNPFVADNNPQTLGEIWAYGLRNPHRFSWDTVGEGKMIIADTGQAFIEEVNLGIKGANYGWGNREGTWVIEETNENILYPLPKNDRSYGYTYPVAQYDHDIPPDIEDTYAIAIAGGYVYRGKAIPDLIGQYIFADFGHDARFFHVPVDELVNGKQAEIQELRLFDGDRETTFLEILGEERSHVRFGIDEEGEIYVTAKEGGTVRKFVPLAKN